MKRELLKHKLAYAVLFIGLLLLAIFFFALWPNHFYQRLIAFLLGLFYFVWGVLTHLKTEEITKQVILEYLGVAFLATALLTLVTF